MASLRFGMDLRVLVFAPLPVLLGCAIFTGERWRDQCSAGAIRYVEVLVLAVRYHTSFDLIGSAIDGRSALGFACVATIASMIPLVSNGLGLREWSTGLVAPALSSRSMALGLTADLVNRAVEIIVAIPTGLIGLAMLARMRNKSRAAQI